MVLFFFFWMVSGGLNKNGWLLILVTDLAFLNAFCNEQIRDETFNSYLLI